MPSLLLAWLSAPPTQREELVREAGALADVKNRPRADN